MKLSDLFQQTPILEELAVSFDSEHKPDFNPAYSKIVGTANSNDIWASRYYGNSADVYGILNDSQIVAYVIIKPLDDFYEIHKIWVDKNHRSRSFAISLVYFLVKKIKIKLLSGKLVTNLGKQFLERLMSNSKFKISIVDTNLEFVSNNFDDSLKNSSNQVLIEHTDIGDDRLFGHSNFNFGRQLYKEHDLFEHEL